jgi:2',3'-cyclic-nucleotide 2'-phosphodiesterase (5'-nucleotidase family)
MNDFFGLSQVDGSAIGNHEFDFGPDFLFPFMSSKSSPNLAANLRSEKN